ncbi:hypothetical protein [Psychrobacter sp. P11G5]|uniref:hypothetical protein n=1 Tax=unclassified Psychrobacter TaxID=196806 RepID=UPI00078D591C|nr:hypothetical protein [Psychrobacter sp. P11G5]AMN67794.1 hypothetical protein AK825_08825 [Psychrobacter sp. P11G5]
MTDPNKLNTKLADSDKDNLAQQQINSQQVSVKAWSQKILVVLLCIASFYGGWKSHESSMVNQCFASGGQIVEGDKTILCKLS